MPLTSAADCVDPPLVDRTWTRVERLEPRPHQVNDADDSDEWEQDEVTYLTLDFGAKLAFETLSQERGHIQLLGLESSTPYARVGPQYYQGQHETLIGDQVLLQHHPKTETSPPHYVPLPSTSTSRVYFRPVSIKPKEDPVTVVDPTTRTSPIPASLLTTGKVKYKSRVAPRTENAPPKVVKVKKKPGRPKGVKNKYKKGQWADEDDAEDANDQEEGNLPALPTLEMENPEELEGPTSLQGGRSPTPPPPPPPPPKRRGRPPKPKDPNAPPKVAKKAKAPAKRRVKRIESDASLDSSDYWEGGSMDVDKASEEENILSNVDTSSNAAAGGSTRRVPRRSAATAAAAAVAGGEKLVISDDDEDEA